MSGDRPDLVTVGCVNVPVAQAEQWIGEYTDARRNLSAADPYAFPAYDRFQGDDNDPLVLSDADLLAPTLLNVPVKIRTFYGLARVRDRLEGALRHPAMTRPLEEIEDPEAVSAMVSPLYEVLDGTEAPNGVQGTTLSKVLHRKRPASIVLHDKWVRACYVGDDAPVARAEVRSWAEYMSLISIAIGADIRAQPNQFARLAAACSCPGELTAVRLLDIVAWRSRGSSPSEAGE